MIDATFDRRLLLKLLFTVFVLAGIWALAADAAPDLKTVHKIYIDKLDNNLDQYLRSEFFTQMKGEISIVLDEKDADAILTGICDEKKGTGAKSTGRYLGLHDIATGSLSMLDH
jgi:hypothetical protein